MISFHWIRLTRSYDLFDVFHQYSRTGKRFSYWRLKNNDRNSSIWTLSVQQYEVINSQDNSSHLEIQSSLIKPHEKRYDPPSRRKSRCTPSTPDYEGKFSLPTHATRIEKSIRLRILLFLFLWLIIIECTVPNNVESTKLLPFSFVSQATSSRTNNSTRHDERSRPILLAQKSPHVILSLIYILGSRFWFTSYAQD